MCEAMNIIQGDLAELRRELDGVLAELIEKRDELDTHSVEIPRFLRRRDDDAA
jgi:hypothetical protein